LPESSDGQIRSFPLSISFHRDSSSPYITMINRPVGGRTSETWFHPINQIMIMGIGPLLPCRLVTIQPPSQWRRRVFPLSQRRTKRDTDHRTPSSSPYLSKFTLYALIMAWCLICRPKIPAVVMNISIKDIQRKASNLRHIFEMTTKGQGFDVHRKGRFTETALCDYSPVVTLIRGHGQEKK
jgi:hypothetical protein